MSIEKANLALIIDLANRMGKSGDAADVATLFAHLAKIEGFTDSIETILGVNTATPGTSSVFARLAQIAGYTDTIEGVLGTNADAAATNASIWAMLKTLNNKPSAPASAIKSVQRGKATITTSTNWVDITIAAVSMSKSQLVNLGFTPTGATSGPNVYFPHLSLTSPTTIQARRNSLDSSEVTVSWELTEYN